MGNSLTRDLKISEERRSSRCGPAGASTPDPTSEQRQRCFRDILDLVLQLSDEELKAMGMEKEKVSRLEFVAACSKIVTTVSSAVFGHLMIPLSESFGMKAILEANDKLKKMESKKSSKLSDASAQSSSAEPSDFICELSQRIVSEIKGAMLEAIRSAASESRRNGSVRASSSAGHRISMLDDLSMACSKEICERILALYLSEEGVRPGGETSSRTSLKSHQEVHGIMKSLEEVVSISRSSSWCTISSNVSSTVTTTPEPEEMTPKNASSAPQAERLFSEQFLSKASQAIREVLLRTEQKLAQPMSPQTSAPASSGTELNCLMELVRNTATEILHKLFFILVQSLHTHLSGVSGNVNQSGPKHEQTFLSDAQTIHMDIQKQVFSFMCERQQAVENRNSQLNVCPVAPSEPGVSSKNTQQSAADEVSLEATIAASDILERTLSSHNSTVKSLGSSTVMPMEDIDLDYVASDIVNKVISGVALEVRLTAMKSRQKALVCDADGYSASDSMSSSGFSTLEDRKSVQQCLDTERKTSNRLHVSQHFFSLVHNRLSSFLTSLSAAEDKMEENSVSSIYISEDGRVHELTESDNSQNVKKSFLEKSNKILNSVQFHSDIIDGFEKEQIVVSTRLSNESNWINCSDEGDGGIGSNWIECSDRHAKDQEKKQKKSGVSFDVKAIDPSVSTPKKVHYASDRHPRTSPKLFQNTRKRLGRFFSNIFKTKKRSK